MKKEIKSLTPIEWKTLRTIEDLMKSFFFVPKELIVKQLKISPTQMDYILVDLCGRKLIKVLKKRNFTGFQLTYFGYDLLGLKYLLDNKYITEIGTIIEKGKESDIYSAFLGDKKYAIKVYHIGRTSFKNIYRKRLFFFKRRWKSWLHASYLSARREYEITKKILEFGVRTTRPIVQNRGLILFEFLENTKELGRVVVKNPMKLFFNIMDDYSKIVNKLRIVHGDFNVFNVLVDGDTYYIIDWGQYLDIDDPGAIDILKKELDEFIDYFQRKYRLKINEKDIYFKFEPLHLDRQV